MLNLHILHITEQKQTNTHPARILITSHRFQQKITISYPDQDPANENNPLVSTAINYLMENGFNVIGKGIAKYGWNIVTTTFKPLCK